MKTSSESAALRARSAFHFHVALVQAVLGATFFVFDGLELVEDPTLPQWGLLALGLSALHGAVAAWSDWREVSLGEGPGSRPD